MSGPLQPPVALLCKLASIAVHADELLSSDGHPLDQDALQAGLADAEVQRWLEAMTELTLAPRKRSAG